MQIHIGTSGYAYKEWKGKFYPTALPAPAMFAYYAERFATTEINSTFYGMPEAATVTAWAAAAPAGFTFSLKAPQRITHFERLRNTSNSTRDFIALARRLRVHAGPILFGLAPNMKKDSARLREFVAALPKGPRFAFEFRHPSWFDDETYATLRARNLALCIADTDDLRTPTVATADWGYLRLRRVTYRAPALAKWLGEVRAQPWSEAFIYFKHEETATGPKLARRLLDLAAAPT
ncbi:hypothetical protein BH11PLA1_BH11PLA1_05230 [soil metagenome]